MLAGMSENTVSDIFDPTAWRPVSGFDFTDITYHRAIDADGKDEEIGRASCRERV